MFTGIIQEVGTLEKVTARGDALRLTVRGGQCLAAVKAGDSVAVNGICLTATAGAAGGRVTFDAVRETLARTTAGAWQAGQAVNLEPALTPSSRMGGHIVQGHIDGTARLSGRETRNSGIELAFAAQPDYLRYIVPKGSIAVNGVSLTIAGVDVNVFRIAIVPFTLENTTLGALRTGDAVNVETDILGRYVERLLQDGLAAGGGSGALEALIRQSGYSGRKA